LGSFTQYLGLDPFFIAGVEMVAWFAEI
jgi:hypothetical protein